MTENNKTLVALLVLIIGIAGIFIYRSFGTQSGSGLRSTSAPQEKEMKKINMVVTQDTGDVNLLVDFAKDKNFFTKRGLEVNKIPVAKKAPNILVAGEADVLVAGLSASLTLYLNDIDVRWIASPFQNFGYTGVSRFSKEKIGSVKKVVINDFGAESHLRAVIALKNLGVDPAKVEFVAAPFVSQAELFNQGKVDFMILPSETFLSNLDQAKKYYTFNYNDIMGSSNLLRAVITTKKALAEKPAEVKSFILAIHDTVDYMAANPDEVKKYMEEKYGYSAESAGRFYDEFILAKKNSNYVPDADSVKSFVELVVSVNKLESTGRKIDDFVFSDFAREAVSLSAK